MKNIPVIFAALTMLVMTNCKKDMMSENPFMMAYNTPFQVPPFDKIDTTHYMPAFLEGIKQQTAEIDAMVKQYGGALISIIPFLLWTAQVMLLARVRKVFYNINEANTNEQMQAIARQIDPVMSKHQDDIYLNEKLFARIKAVYEKRYEMKLDSQQIRVTEKYFRDFERMGANLPKDKQEQLRKINAELSMLSLNFGQNLLAETNKNFKLVIEDSADLAGLPARSYRWCC